MSVADGEAPDADRTIERLSAHLWRVELPVDTLPPYDHTNAYLIVDAGVALLVDPGAADPPALALLERALDAAQVRLLKGTVLTHTHPDHVGGVEGVSAWRAAAGDEPPALYVHALEVERLPAEWEPIRLQGERTLMVGDVAVRCLHTPGHSPGHLTLLLENAGEDRPEAAIVGDLAVASGSVWVGSPEGDMALYLASLERLRELKPRVLAPGHGPAIVNVQKRLRELADHRMEREAQVLAALEGGPATADQVTAAVYEGLPEDVLALARQSVLAHLLKLMNELRVVHLGDDESGPYAVRR